MIIEKYKWMIDDNKDSKNIIDDILEDRGITSLEDKEMFLFPRLDRMHDPMKLKDMDKAIRRIASAKENNEKITIYGDYDVDGITSTSILYMYLKDNGHKVDYYIPNRVTEGYGFNKKALEEINERGSSLVISVDTGISANEEVDYANGLGLDIIVTDHHECQEDLPDAYAIINPKRLDSNYPFQELAGVGVAFKLIHALAINYNNIDSIWKYIDIVAIGTVADVVPLIDENRIIVKNAFDTIPSTWNVGLRSLLKVSGCKDGKISSGTIGFQIGPRLNVAGRLGEAKKGVELFTTSSKEVADQISKDLDNENKKRQEIEQDIFEQAVRQIESNQEISKDNVIVVASKGWHNGVIGIVASRLTELYYKPSIVISIEEDKATGSARSIEGFSMFDALCNSKDYLMQFGGHDMAAGLSLGEDKIDGFRKHINGYSKGIIDEDMLRRKLKIDYIINDGHISLDMVEELESLEPYGVANPTPIFAYPAKVYSVRNIGSDGSHLKMQFYTEDKLIDSIGFHIGDLGNVISKDEEILVAGSLQKNEWQGKVSPQIVIKDIKSPQSEIMRSKFYLSLYEEITEPTVENLKVFTNSIEVCYINSYGSKELLKTNKSFEKLLSYLIPTREDCVYIYKYLKNLYKSQKNEVSIHLLKMQAQNNNMTEYKILQILDIFVQLDLISYKFNFSDGLIEFNIIDGIRTDLSKSKRYRQLSEFNEKRF